MITENDHYELELKNVKCEELLASPEKRDILHARQQEISGLTAQLQEIDSQYRPVNNSGTTALTFAQQCTHSAHSPTSTTTLYIISAICPGDSECNDLIFTVLTIESLCRYTVNVKVNDGIADALRIIDYQGFSYARFGQLLQSSTIF